MLLEIAIITYNRSINLRRTLKSLSASAVSDLRITVYDNCSTDNTFNVYNEFSAIFGNIKYVKHKYNIGLGANFLRAMENSESLYTWVLCDDDELIVNNVQDIFEIISTNNADLIHVGAHRVNEWVWAGKLNTIKSFIEMGYPYFRFSSFIPCNIIRTSIFCEKYLRLGYDNVVNAYPHMPYLLDCYRKNLRLYISKNKLVNAVEKSDGYGFNDLFFWWANTCIQLPSKKEIQYAFFDQWGHDKNSVKIAMRAIFRVYSENKNLRRKVDLQVLKTLGVSYFLIFNRFKLYDFLRRMRNKVRYKLSAF